MDTAIVLLTLPIVAASLGAVAQQAGFQAARPVWPEDRERDMNLTVGFRAVVEAPENERVVLRLTASPLYRAFINGAFCAYGPARGPHGWYRVDEWDVTDMLRAGPNVVAIEVAGYNVNSYYLLDQPAFLQAEVVAGDRVLAATGLDEAPFAARVLPGRIQKVERYSFQRAFIEVYRLSPAFDAWRSALEADLEPALCPAAPEKSLLPRRVSYPMFALKPARRHVAAGRLAAREGKFKLRRLHGLVGIGADFKGFPESELETIPSLEIQKYATASSREVDAALDPQTKLPLKAGDFHILDFGTNFTGFLGATARCTEPTRLLFAFDEILTDGDVDVMRLSCLNIISYELATGSYCIESFEPYTMKYVKAIVLEGACELSDVYLREYVNPDTTEARFAAADERLNTLFAAGVETFAQNAVDVFMDCPSRERAGWLCDSFFTARVAKDLAGHTRVEKNFFENFLLPERFAHLPDGMLPMCYPADHYNGNFIPNWALWFVVQLEEYLQRSGDRELVDALKPKVLALFDYFKPFRNEDGLLEKLERWVFVEWSKANRFVQDVNYPTNMLYAGALAGAGRMYGMPELVEQGHAIRDVVRRQSYDGAFFVDNALRKDTGLEVTRNRSEMCQYFAFFFDVATPESHPELWRKLRDEFGPYRAETKAYPEIHAANSFVGNMLRFEVLSRYGRCQQILDESIDYLLYMAERTGTLWENVHSHASCNHGFASHIVHTLYRDVLGLYGVDTVNKRIRLRFGDVTLPHCEGAIPTPGGPITLEWRIENGSLVYSLSSPEDYAVEVENPGGRALTRQ